MRNIIFAALAALSLSALAPAANAAVFHNGSSMSDDGVATRMQQTGSYTGN